MRKFEKILKNNWPLILGVIIGIIGGFTITLIVNADTILFASGSVSYSNTTSELTSTTVQGAIDELYTKVSNFECKSGYEKNSSASDSYTCKKKPICKAVTSASGLHTETCSQTSNYCAADGYTGSNSTITYGSIWDGDVEHLAAGNAFDCDVTGDGNYNERFYYVSDYYNTQSQTFDTDTGVLIYYKNFVSGAPSDSGAAYDSSGNNWHGPRTAVTHLPQTTGTNAWRDDLLKIRERTIKACNDVDCGTISNATSGGTITPNPFDYGSTTAARLLTLQELKHAGCDTLSSQTSLSSPGALKNCNFLFERTYYANKSGYPTYGSWLETPLASFSRDVWYADNEVRNVSNSGASLTYNGVRPAIDVAKSRLK